MNQETADLILEKLTSIESRFDGMETNINIMHNDISAMNVRINDIEMNSHGYQRLIDLETNTNKAISSINTKLDKNIRNTKINSINIDYIKQNVDIKNVREKSFWKDNWYCSTIAVPVLQLLASGVYAYTTPEHISISKKED